MNNLFAGEEVNSFARKHNLVYINVGIDRYEARDNHASTDRQAYRYGNGRLDPDRATNHSRIWMLVGRFQTLQTSDRGKTHR